MRAQFVNENIVDFKRGGDPADSMDIGRKHNIETEEYWEEVADLLGYNFHLMEKNFVGGKQRTVHLRKELEDERDDSILINYKLGFYEETDVHFQRYNNYDDNIKRISHESFRIPGNPKLMAEKLKKELDL